MKQELWPVSEKIELVCTLAHRMRREARFRLTIRYAFFWKAFRVSTMARETCQMPRLVMEQCLLLQRLGILTQLRPSSDPDVACFDLLGEKVDEFRPLLRALDLIP
ncbi:MAG: hypothetical protein KGI60_01775 [Patescibacteria group bacterium]|nr:hypothetical protein [Patescibacteria group bacterium]